MTLPNILLLTVDAFRSDRMEFQGYEMNTTPNLNEMVKKSIWCRNAFSLVGTTQPSFPTIFTSTRPLSYGGYDQGIANRPNSLPEILQQAGYETVHLLTFAWMRATYGYGKGVERKEHYYSIKDIIGAALLTIKSTILAYRDAILSFDEMMESVAPVIRRCIEDVITCCNERMSQTQIEETFFRYSFFVRERYDFSRIRAFAEDHLRKFDKSPKDYINRHIVGLQSMTSNVWMSSYFYFKRYPSKLITMGWDFALKLIAFLTRKHEIRLHGLRHKAYVDSGDLTDRIIAILKESRSRPLFITTHYIDTHVPYSSGRLPNWYRKTPVYLKKVGYQDNTKLSYLTLFEPKTDEELEAWNRFYDASVRYTDEQFGRLMKALKETGQRENTIVIITGDHGEEIGEHGDFSHRFRLYDESIHVPIVFFHPDLKEKRIDDLVDLRDLAPTILDLGGMRIPESYDGRPVMKMDGNGRKHVIIESFYRANCLFAHRPVYMGIRTDRYKYIWKEWIDPLDKISKERIELYDLKEDEGEKHNIFNPDSELVKYFNGIITQRLKEIPEIDSSRYPAEL